MTSQLSIILDEHFLLPKLILQPFWQVTGLNFTHELRLRSIFRCLLLLFPKCKARSSIIGQLNSDFTHTHLSYIPIWCRATSLPLSAHLSSVEMESQRGQKAQGVTAGAQSHGKWQITTLMSAIYHLFPLFSLPFPHSCSFFPLSSTFCSIFHDYLKFYYNKPSSEARWLKWRN